MTFKGLLLFLLTMVVANLPRAHADQMGMPSNAASSAGIDYWFIKNLIFDIDTELKNAGLQAEACTYRSNITKKDSSFKGLGRCLFLHFSESMETTGSNTGITYFWLDASHKQPIEIHWRPPKAGLGSFLNQVYEMKYENSLYWWRDLVGKASAESIPYKEFLLGDIKLVVPDDEGLLNKIEIKGNPWISNYLKKVREIGIHLSPSERKMGVVVHKGTISAKVKTTKGGEENINLAVETNINILVLSRKFYFRGVTDSEAAHVP